MLGADNEIKIISLFQFENWENDSVELLLEDYLKFYEREARGTAKGQFITSLYLKEGGGHDFVAIKDFPLIKTN